MIVLERLFLTIAPRDAVEPRQLGSRDASTQRCVKLFSNLSSGFRFLKLSVILWSLWPVVAVEYEISVIPCWCIILYEFDLWSWMYGE